MKISEPLHIKDLELQPDDSAIVAPQESEIQKAQATLRSTKRPFDAAKAAQIFDMIDAATHVRLVMHKGPDGDTAGSALGMSHYLDSIQKPHTVFCKDALPPYLQFLPGKEKINTDPAQWELANAEFDLLMTFDGGDLGYLGVADYIDELKASGKTFPIINIDHHETNKDFGDVNYVIRNGSAACEIVHDLLQWKGGLNAKSSQCLMTGLLTDTGHFMNLGTTASAVNAASGLLKQGLNLQQLSRHTMRNQSFATLKLWGIALERLMKTENGLVYTVVTQDDIDSVGADEDAVGGISNFLNSLDQTHEAQAILVLRQETPTMVKGSLRTTRPDIDVSKTALSFGGGGHKKAAGFSIEGTLQEDKVGHWHVAPINETATAQAVS